MHSKGLSPLNYLMIRMNLILLLLNNYMINYKLAVI